MAENLDEKLREIEGKLEELRKERLRDIDEREKVLDEQVKSNNGKLDGGESSAAKSSWRWVKRFVAIGIAVIVLHDSAVLLNMACCAAIHNVGASITQSTARGDTKDFMLASLAERKGDLNFFGYRPLVWLLSDDTNQFRVAMLDLIATLDGKSTGNDVADFFLHNKSSIVNRLTGRGLNAYGHAVVRASDDHMKKCLERGWIVRLLPLQNWIFGAEPKVQD